MSDFIRQYGFDLQLFADGDGGGDGDNSGGGGDGNPNDGDNDQPFAVFPDEASLMARINREAQKQLANQAKALGYDTVEAMQEALKSYQERQNAEKSELEKAKEAAQKADSERKKALESANNRLIRAEVKLRATELGIVDDDAAFALMDRSEVSVDDQGRVQGVEAALKSLLETKPYLKKQDSNRSGEDFHGGGSCQPDVEKMSMAEYIEYRKKQPRG